jgi:hypothetical protein
MKNLSVSLNANKAISELNSFTPIRACLPWRVTRGQTWLAGILILLSFPNAFAQTDFRHFGKNLNPLLLLATNQKW